MISPERQLWAAVLGQAVNDALREKPYSVLDRLAATGARSWMDGQGKDFRMVCTLAGMDPDAVSAAWRSGRVERITTKHRAVTVGDAE